MSSKRVAIVSGGASGIGYAITQKLVSQNIIVYMIGRNKSNLDQAMKNLGQNCKAIVYDLSQLEGIPALVQEIYQAHGKIDILVNNAGINEKKAINYCTRAKCFNMIDI